MGHSQGGGAAWGGAQRQVERKVDRYLGTVAGSLVTDVTYMIRNNPDAGTGLAWCIAQGIKSSFPDFQPEDWLTNEGVKRLRLMQELSGCNSVEDQVFNEQGLTKPEWVDSWYMQAYRTLTSNGGRFIEGPMLVLQGTADPAVNVTITEAAVNKTYELFPESQIQYGEFEGATHVPVLDARQQIWLRWIEDRFMAKRVKNGCQSRFHRPLRDVAGYQKELEYYLQLSLEGYTVA